MTKTILGDNVGDIEVLIWSGEKKDWWTDKESNIQKIHS